MSRNKMNRNAPVHNRTVPAVDVIKGMLARKSGATVVQVAERLGWTRSSVAGRLSTLIGAGELKVSKLAGKRTSAHGPAPIIYFLAEAN